MIVFLIKYIYYWLFGNFKTLGWRVGFSHGTRFKHTKFIELGNNVFLGHHVFLHIPDEYQSIKSTPQLKIGNHVTIGFNTKINAVKKILVEDHVLISPNCYITDHNHSYQNHQTPIRYQGIDSVGTVHIKKGAWIGTQTTILSGVTIGKNAVVGANSVVTKDVPDHSVAVGSPAEVIKQYNKKTKKWEKA